MRLFTDGVTEASNAAGEIFGEERLLRLSLDRRRRSASESLESMLKAVGDFGGGSFQDDMTLVASQLACGAAIGLNMPGMFHIPRPI